MPNNTDLKVFVDTGDLVFDAKITKYLTSIIIGFGAVVTEDPIDADIIITTPDFIKSYSGYMILLLTDNIEYMKSDDDVVEFTPVPITSDDYSRLEFRLLSLLSRVREE